MSLYSLNLKVPDTLQNHLLLKTVGDNVIIGIYIHKCIYFYATFPIWILPLSFHSTSEDVFDRKYEEWEFQGAGMQIFKLLVFLFILYFEPQTLQFLLFRNSQIAPRIYSCNDSEVGQNRTTRLMWGDWQLCFVSCPAVFCVCCSIL